MKDKKEFHGKTLDGAIMAACEFYGVEREKLEIEIVNDSKMGIFGLVNVKKACVRASLADTDSLLEGLTETLAQTETETPKGRKGKTEKQKPSKSSSAAPARTAKGGESRGGPEKSPEKSPERSPEKLSEKPSKSLSEKTLAGALPSDESDSANSKPGREPKPANEGRATNKEKEGRSASTRAGGTRAGAKDTRETRDNRATADEATEKTADKSAGKQAGRSPKGERTAPKADSRPRRGRNTERRMTDAENGIDGDENGLSDSFSLADLTLLDQDELRVMIHEVVNRLVSSIIGEVPLTITIEDGHIRVKVDCEEDARILVGREGQTLASVQYIASRILAGKLQGAVRLHIDTGNYKENQDARLTDLALMLAEKLRKSGRTQSTRPLSAYQRRIVHLALEGEEDIQTSSKGDGSQRRVLIHFKRNRNQKTSLQPDSQPGLQPDCQPDHQPSNQLGTASADDDSRGNCAPETSEGLGENRVADGEYAEASGLSEGMVSDSHQEADMTPSGKDTPSHEETSSDEATSSRQEVPDEPHK